MPVYDTNDSPINPDHFVNKLIGALCEVTFTLKHYAIGAQKKSKDDGKDVEPHDIFSAQVESVAVLKNPPTIVRSPYKGRIIKRPHHRPQIPTRGEQVNAAEAFVSESHPLFGSSSTAPITPPAAKMTGGELVSANSAATLVSDDDDDRSIGQVSSLKRKFTD